MEIICHNRKLSIKESKIITTTGKECGYLSEFLIEAKCSVCNKVFIIHIWVTFDGKEESREYIAKYIPEKDEIKGRAARRFLTTIVHREKLYKERQVDRRFFLRYFGYGTKNLKCFSNLSSLKMGKVDYSDHIIHESNDSDIIEDLNVYSENYQDFQAA